MTDPAELPMDAHEYPDDGSHRLTLSHLDDCATCHAHYLALSEETERAAQQITLDMALPRSRVRPTLAETTGSECHHGCGHDRRSCRRGLCERWCRL